MRLQNDLNFKSMVFDVADHGSLKVEVRASYDVEHNVTKYKVNDLKIDAVFGDEHIDPNVNIVTEIGKENLDLLLDEAYEKLATEMDDINESDLKE